MSTAHLALAIGLCAAAAVLALALAGDPPTACTWPRILIQAGVISVAVAACAVSLALHGPGVHTVVVGLLGAALPAVLVHDLVEQRIPNRVTGCLAAAGFALAAGSAAMTGAWAHLGVVLALSVAVVAFYLLCALIGGLGLRDVKLAGAQSMALGWLGITPVLHAVLYAALLGAAVALYVYARHQDARRRFAFGPSLALGFLVAGLLG